MEHRVFHYKSLEDLREEMKATGVSFPLSENTALLGQPLSVHGKTIPNRLAIQPMEGCDSTPEYTPGEYMLRRYDRFARSGAGLIWVEATAVSPEGRATPGQMVICPETLDALKALVESIRETAFRETATEPLVILQATHSGRYSKPHGYPEPLIAYNNPVFEKDKPIDAGRILSDDQLKAIEEKYYGAAKMAEEAGFDGIDVKACHRYLNCELLSAYTRPGEYGGSFENRTRFFRNAFANAKAGASGKFIVTSRMNIYDGFPYPYGFGTVQEDGSVVPDMTEPIRLIGMLKEQGLELLDITMGNPYVNPHVNRPYDQGGYVPPEHPLEGVSRIATLTGQVADSYPDLAIIFSGPSYLRQFSANLAAGIVEAHPRAMVGFGREAFAYPSFPKELLETGAMDPRKVCITCGKCAELLRSCYPAGCVVRDHVYTDIYRRMQQEKKG